MLQKLFSFFGYNQQTPSSQPSPSSTFINPLLIAQALDEVKMPPGLIPLILDYHTNPAKTLRAQSEGLRTQIKKIKLLSPDPSAWISLFSNQHIPMGLRAGFAIQALEAFINNTLIDFMNQKHNEVLRVLIPINFNTLDDYGQYEYIKDLFFAPQRWIALDIDSYKSQDEYKQNPEWYKSRDKTLAEYSLEMVGDPKVGKTHAELQKLFRQLEALLGPLEIKSQAQPASAPSL